MSTSCLRGYALGVTVRALQGSGRVSPVHPLEFAGIPESLRWDDLSPGHGLGACLVPCVTHMLCEHSRTLCVLTAYFLQLPIGPVQAWVGASASVMVY